MKRQNVVLMLFLAFLLIASTAESTEVENALQTVVLECATVIPAFEPGPMPLPGGEFPPPESVPPTPEVIAVSGTPGAPEINVGEQCGIAIGKLMNNRFRLLSATPTSTEMPGVTPEEASNVSSVQYLFVSRPAPRWQLR